MDFNIMGVLGNSVNIQNVSNTANQYSDANIAQNNAIVSGEANVEQLPKAQKSEKNKENSSNADNKSGNKEEQVKEAIKKLNQFLEKNKTHAEYSEYKPLNTVMVKIVEDSTNRVVMELPSEKILDMVASLCEQAGLIDKKA